MTCSVCEGKGLIRVNWTDAPEDYAVCLCHVGCDLLVTRNERAVTVPLWRVWCAREQVDPARVLLLEDVVTPTELAECGLVLAPAADREARLMAAGKRKGTA